MERESFGFAKVSIRSLEMQFEWTFDRVAQCDKCKELQQVQFVTATVAKSTK